MEAKEREWLDELRREQAEDEARERERTVLVSYCHDVRARYQAGVIELDVARAFATAAIDQYEQTVGRSYGFHWRRVLGGPHCWLCGLGNPREKPYCCDVCGASRTPPWEKRHPWWQFWKRGKGA